MNRDRLRWRIVRAVAAMALGVGLLAAIGGVSRVDPFGARPGAHTPVADVATVSGEAISEGLVWG